MQVIMQLPDRFTDIDPPAIMMQTFSAPAGEGNRMPGSRDITVEVTVNGARHTAEVPARTLLVHCLRPRPGLTGTSVACETTQGSSCTVALDGLAVKSCTILAAQGSGH